MPRKVTKASRRKHKTFILVLDKDDPEKELEFELDFQLTLSAAERYELMNRLVKDGLRLVKQNGYQRNPSIVARP